MGIFNRKSQAQTQENGNANGTRSVKKSRKLPKNDVRKLLVLTSDAGLAWADAPVKERRGAVSAIEVKWRGRKVSWLLHENHRRKDPEDGGAFWVVQEGDGCSLPPPSATAVSETEINALINQRAVDDLMRSEQRAERTEAMMLVCIVVCALGALIAGYSALEISGVSSTLKLILQAATQGAGAP